MKQQSLSISIPEPCHENWSEMSPVEKGRHCQSCQKTVIDFTRMPKVEITEFVSAQNGNLCGRFSTDQLNVELIPPKPSKTWFKYAAILLGLIPNIGYGQEVIVPEKPVQEMPLSRLIGDVEIETKGEVIKQVYESNQDLIISGQVVDSRTCQALKASMIVHSSNGGKKHIYIDQNGQFLAKVSKRSVLSVKCKGYETQIFRYADLQSKNQLLISLQRVEIGPMGMVIMHKNKPKHAPKTGCIKVNSKQLPKKIDPIKKIEPKRAKKIESINNTKAMNRGEKINSDHVYTESDERLNNLLPTVELVAKRIERKQICATGLYGVTTVEEENWFKRLWRKFKSLVKNSHEEAQKNEASKKLLAVSALTTDNENDKGQTSKINQTFEVDQSQDILKQNEDIDLNIYPNPSAGLFNIAIPDRMEKFFIEVTDINNQLILSQNQDQFSGMIELGTKEAGSYIISIISEGQLITSKMVVKI